MKFSTGAFLLILLIGGSLPACHPRSSHADMVALLSAMRDSESVAQNPFYPEGGISRYDSMLQNSAGLQNKLIEIGRAHV